MKHEEDFINGRKKGNKKHVWIDESTYEGDWNSEISVCSTSLCRKIFIFNYLILISDSIKLKRVDLQLSYL